MNRQSPASKSILEYTDFRLFLKDHSIEMRAASPTWTIKKWSHELGLMATTSLTMIINGQRRPGEKILERLSTYFVFSEEEKRYFEYLVRLDKADRDPAVKDLLETELKKFNAAKTDVLVLDEARFKSISSWYHLAIRQLAYVKALENNPASIKNKLIFEVSEDEIREAVRNLEIMGLVKIDNGYIYPNNGSISTTQDVPSEAIREYHRQAMARAEASLAKVHPQDRDFQGRTLTLSKANLGKAKELLRKFSREFGALVDEEQGEVVYQLNTQFFPLSHPEQNNG